MPKTAEPFHLKPAKTLTTLLLDRSGSMFRHHAQTITAINGWIGKLRSSGEDIRLSFIQFDRHAGEICLEKVHVARRIAEVPDLEPADFSPRGDTPLIDAAMDTILAIAASLEGPRGEGVKVVIAIQTDGLENASRRYTWDDLKTEIARREAAGWEFVFMGAGLGQTTYEMADMMGISAEKTISYGTDMAETRAAFEATAMNTVAYASGIMRSMAYTDIQKSASGDVASPGARPVRKSKEPAPAAPAAPVGAAPGYMMPGALGLAPQGGNPFWGRIVAGRRMEDPVAADPAEAALLRSAALTSEISAALDAPAPEAKP